MKKPNLVYVFADQLRWASVGYNGDKLARTPNIDRLAAESADVVNAVSGHPVCAPYRATLLTGKYTTSTGMVINEIRMNTRHRTFAHVLNDAGYETSYIGKWHLYAAQGWGLTATLRRTTSTTAITRRTPTITLTPRRRSMPRVTSPIS